jgi:hypothetical protein
VTKEDVIATASTRHVTPDVSGMSDRSQAPRMMARPPTGQLIQKRGERGTTFAIRFRATAARTDRRPGTA